jgi:hypothetical protein
MSRITTRTLSAVLAFMIPTLAAAQTREEVVEDREVYVVESKYPAVTYPDGYVLNDNYRWESSLPFDPRREYTPEEQQRLIDEELRITGGRLTRDSDGSAVIELEQPEIPEATRDTAPPPEDIYEEDGAPPLPQFTQGDSMSPASGPATYTRRYLHSNGFGNNIFGAGYSIDTFIQATNATATTAKKVSAYIEGKVKGTAFNHTKELIRARIDVAGQQGGTNSGTAKLYAMGQLIYSQNLAANFSLTPVNLSRNFFSAKKTFMVGPVPVTVTAALKGGVRLSLSGSISPTLAKLNATPGGYVNVTASAAVNVIIVSFGVSGSLSLINVNIPATAELNWPICSALTWKLGASLSLNTLSGTLKLFVKVKILFVKKTWYVTIAKWSGITKSVPLFSKSGSYAMGICPGFAPAEAPVLSMAGLQ